MRLFYFFFFFGLSDNRPLFHTGDFRQCPPVIPKGSRPQIVDACINRASFWANVVNLPLKINMRVLRNSDNMTEAAKADAANFAKWLLEVGDGLKDGDERDLLRLPPACCIPSNFVNSADQLIDAIYPNLRQLPAAEDPRGEYFKERASSHLEMPEWMASTRGSLVVWLERRRSS